MLAKAWIIAQKSAPLFEENVPLTSRIGNSFFTQMILIGNDEYRKHTGIPYHLDKDRITCIVNFGDVKKGGSTMFYDSLDDKSDIKN